MPVKPMTLGDSEGDTGWKNFNPLGKVGILQFTLLSPIFLDFVDFRT